MTTFPRRIALIALVLIASAAAAEAVTITMPLSQVKPGMKGRGKSVFQGQTIEDFEVEILGVLENNQPKRNIILARLKGRGLESTGIIQGMSGSPVYIDGKLIGAVAYGFSFSKEPIAGITPIEEMLAVERAPAEPKAGAVSAPPLRDDLSQAELSETFLRALASRPDEKASGAAISPLDMPLVFSGFSAGAFERARAFFAPSGFRAVRAGTGVGQTPAADAPAGPSVREGDAVGVQLIGGDLDLSAVGTATYVDGKKILAFGHPLYNLGAVEYGLTRADVIAVMPSLESSFKLATAGPVIGRFTQDRTAGTVGEIGVMPRLIPLNISVRTGSGDRKDFKLKLVADKFLTPALVNLAVSGLITGEQRSLGDISLDFDADIFLDKGGLSVHLEDLFSGSYDNPAVSLSGLLAAVVHYLMNNEFKDVGILPHRSQRPGGRGDAAGEAREGPARQVRGLPGRAHQAPGLLPDAEGGEPDAGGDRRRSGPAGRDRVPAPRRRRRHDAAGRAGPIPHPGVRAAEPRAARPPARQPPQEQPHLFPHHGDQARPLP